MSFAKALSSYSDGTSHGVADSKHLIDEDLRYRKAIPVNYFVEHMLCCSLGDCIDHWILEELCDAKETRGLLDEFCFRADERSRYEPFASQANRLLNYRKVSDPTFCHNHLRLIQESVAEPKPDVVLVFANSQLEYGAELPEGPSFYWNDVYYSIEFTVKKTEGEKEAEPVMNLDMGSVSNEGSRKPAAGSPLSQQPQAQRSDRTAAHTDERLQSASYALEMLSRERYRNHVINITIQDISMCLCFYDRVGIVKSVAFRVTDLAVFGRVISAMGSLSPGGWGFHDFTIYDTFTLMRPLPAGSRYSERQMNQPTPPPVFDHESEAPQGTTSPKPSAGTVIRFHNRVVVTLKEIVYRQCALIGRGTCVIKGEVKDHSDLSGKDLMVKISWPSRWRTSEVHFFEAAQTYALNQNDEHILGYIPQVLLHQDFYSTVDGPRGKCTFENDDHRVLRVTVMDSYFPMTQVHTASDLTQVIIDVVKCHRALHEGPKILHRDISMNNIMFCRGKENRVIGVLIDFDLAVEVDPQYRSLHLDRRFRTGTLPFMAIDLLDETDKIHWVRHDLESILWVTVWYTARYHEGIETTMAFQVWQKSNMPALAEKKVYFLSKSRMYEPTALFGSVAVWVRLLLRLFRHARDAREDTEDETSETLDPETLGGRITYETFLHSLGQE